MDMDNTLIHYLAYRRYKKLLVYILKKYLNIPIIKNKDVYEQNSLNILFDNYK